MSAVFELFLEVVGWILESFWYRSTDSFIVKVIKTILIIGVLAGIAYIFSMS